MEKFYPHLLAFHNVFGWIVLLAVLVAIFSAFSGWSGVGTSERTLLRVAVLFVVAIDLEFLLGLILYVGASPLTRGALRNIGAAMKSQELRFFAVEHTILMFVAVVLAHLGSGAARKRQAIQQKFPGCRHPFHALPPANVVQNTVVAAVVTGG